MSTVNLRGIPVRFPFDPYDLQKNYMEKVLECLQNQSNGVLESPTGTGKTLSLLCSSLAWLEVKKAQIQAQRASLLQENNSTNDYLSELNEKLNGVAGALPNDTQLPPYFFGNTPTIIYASRTHSQLSQAMQELKRTAYSHMRATVLGSRDQLCIHPEIIKAESNTVKTMMCRTKVKERSCYLYNRNERMKDNPVISEVSILDIEDLVKAGETHKFCPYYMSKELKDRADIIFMPYNYLLDPKVRKSLGVELSNNIIILDEAHNIEKICEESASVQLKSSDVTLAIEEVTHVMKALTEDISMDFDDAEIPKDFTAEDLCVLKQMLLDFEKALDDIPLKKNVDEGTTFDGIYILEIFKAAGILDTNVTQTLNLCEKLVQFLTTAESGPFQRRGNGLERFCELSQIVFSNITPKYRDKVDKCYKVHLAIEEKRKNPKGGDWLTKAREAKENNRVLSFWCFSPGFGMTMLMDQGVYCVILTSGTLAPLRPLISELELNVDVRLENPHIVGGDQVCVKILTKGPDGQELNCNYQNRDNPKYLRSLGLVITNLCRIIPDGILIFFPSYPTMQKCYDFWQETGLWNGITESKPAYIEPRDKIAFNNAMNDYYAKIKDPNYKGAIFMGVCRGKVSEGLDFADMNGRAVFITGLPYPPLKDPRIILKKRYLDICNSKDREFLRGDEWYSLEATRAINQAIGRVIRHRHDYGAIVLLDSRFSNPRIKGNLSMWLQNHIKVAQNFGEVVRDLRVFFAKATNTLPAPTAKPEKVNKPALVEIPAKPAQSTSTSNDTGLVSIYQNMGKRRKITVVSNRAAVAPDVNTSIKEYIIMVKSALDESKFKLYLTAMTTYRANGDFGQLESYLDEIFVQNAPYRYLIHGLRPYIKENHKEAFENYCSKMI